MTMCGSQGGGAVSRALAMVCIPKTRNTYAYDLLVEKVVVLKLGRGREMQSGENGLRIVESSFARWLRKAVTRKIRCID